MLSTPGPAAGQGIGPGSSPGNGGPQPLPQPDIDISPWLWLKADRGLTLDGDNKVAAFQDVLSSGRVLVPHERTGSLRPPVADGYIQFGNGSVLKSAAFWNPGATLHVFLVFRIPDAVPDGTHYFLSNAHVTATNISYFGIRGASTLAHKRLSYAKATTTAGHLLETTDDVQPDRWLIAEWIINGTSAGSMIKINGVGYTSKSLTVGTSAYSQWSIGALLWTDSVIYTPTTWHFKELIMFDSIQGAEAATAIRAYLSTEHNIPLTYPS